MKLTFIPYTVSPIGGEGGSGLRLHICSPAKEESAVQAGEGVARHCWPAGGVVVVSAAGVHCDRGSA